MVDGKIPTVLMAEDSNADQLLAKTAFSRAQVNATLRLVNSGNDAMAYLRGDGKYSNRAEFPAADLVIMDLEMAGMDGRTALHRIKEDPKMRHLPVIIMTSSRDEADVFLAYDWGAASFVMKPDTVDGWSKTLKIIADYWLGVVVKPTDFR